MRRWQYIGCWIAATLLASLSGVPVAVAASTPAQDTVTIFSAGSLRGIVGDLAKQVGSRYHIKIVATFGGSGALRKRIQQGAPADLFLSADVRSPHDLQAAGRTAVPVLTFARNRICIVAPRSAGLTDDNLVDRMLAPGARIWTSTPVVDPGGDYAAEILDKIGTRHPDARAALKARAQAVREATANAPGTGLARFARLFAEHRIDMMITYCSGAATLVTENPDLASIGIPASLDPHPVDGMAVLSDRPAVLRVALYLMSSAGQAIVARNRLVPVTGN